MKIMRLLSLILFSSALSTFSQQEDKVVRKEGCPEVGQAHDRDAGFGASATPKNPAHDQQYGIRLFPKRGGKLDWGLALSGGGVRSAAFNIGAMKALYDNGIMTDIDVISSVSGGGYASYWLYTNYEKNSTLEFGQGAFSNDTFIRNICELQKAGNSNLVPNKDFVRILFKQLRGKREEAFRDYKHAIERSFGNNLPNVEPVGKDLAFLNPAIGKGWAPYFIINSTTDLRSNTKDKQKTAELKKRVSTAFEISPHFRGNPVIGFKDWTKLDIDKPTLGASIAMSGAPKFLGLVGIDDKLTNFNKETVKGQNLYLRDGGFSENLGALALIRRGIKNVIIIDAEADPAYKFDAYVELQKMLLCMGVDFRVPDIELFLKKDRREVANIKPQKGSRGNVFSPPTVSQGEASGLDEKGAPLKSHIYYVKMSLPEAILPDVFAAVHKDQQKCDVIEEGRRIENKRQCLLCPEREQDEARQAEARRDDERRRCSQRLRNYPCDCEKLPVNCNCIKLNLDAEGYKKLYANIVWHYSKHLNKPEGTALWLKTKPFEMAGKLCYFVTKPNFLKGGRFYCSVLSYNFPHITTFDQSYFSDQLEAFVGLGYLQTLKLERRPDQ